MGCTVAATLVLGHVLPLLSFKLRPHKPYHASTNGMPGSGGGCLPCAQVQAQAARIVVDLDTVACIEPHVPTGNSIGPLNLPMASQTASYPMPMRPHSAQVLGPGYFGDNAMDSPSLDELQDGVVEQDVHRA